MDRFSIKKRSLEPTYLNIRSDEGLDVLQDMLNDSNRQDQETEDEVDVISHSIGEYGRWQFYLTFLLSLVNIPCTWHIFVPTFHDAYKEFWCARTDDFADVDPVRWRNYTQPVGPCQIFNLSYLDGETRLEDIQNIQGVHLVKCETWEFEGEGTTVISDFNLVCDRKQLNNMAEMVFLAGVALGGLVSGIISDKCGRKKTLMTSIFLQALLGTLIAFVPWFELYVILRAALGFISVSVVFSGFVLSIELVEGNWRTVAGICYLFPVSLSYMSIAGIAWFLRDWRDLQLAVSLPGFLFLAAWWVLPESPRWLLAMGKTQEVMGILKTAAKVNGRELPHNIDKKLMPATTAEPESGSVMDLFKTHQLRKNTFLLFVIWFSVYLVYYGLVLNVGNIGGDIYINSVISGAVEIPGVAISIIILLKMGRRWPLALTMITAGVSCLIILPFQNLFSNVQWLMTSMAMVAKCSISSSNAVMPVFTAELYPTTIRNIGVGASNVSAGVALMLVPYLWEMSSLHTSVPMALIGGCGIIGGTCVLFLPETGNRRLKDTLQDTDAPSKVSDISPLNKPTEAFFESPAVPKALL